MKPSFYSLTDRLLELWVFNSIHLGNGEVLPGYFDERLYKFCQGIYPWTDVGLLTYQGSRRGGSSGIIRPHTDRAYSLPKAININLGFAQFYIDGQLHLLNDGDLVEFNCKKTHGVSCLLSE